MVALVVLGVAAAVCAVGAHRAAVAADAREAALAAAQERVPALLSYDAATLEADLDRALDQTTGSFHDDYARILDDAVTPTATRREIGTRAEVRGAGVVSGDSDKVVVLVFLTQTTTVKGRRSTVTGSRVEVTMTPVDGGWKIAGLKPV